ncbi:hypothetical protein [Sulfurimonas sp.]
MNNQDICGVVILYNPNEDVVKNILTYAKFLHKLYIVDNSRESLAIQDVPFPCKTMVLSYGVNIGVATALDIALEQALKDSYKWMLTMDQDGSFESLELEQFLKCRSSIYTSDTLLISPLHHRKNIIKTSKCKFTEADFVMTSGNLVCVENATNIGGYERKLFIDEVDHEFCMRGKLKGYKVKSLPSVYVNHQLGTIFNINGKKIRLYSPQRLYYMARNYLFLKNTYKEIMPSFFKKRTLFLLKFFYQHLRFSPYRFECFKMLLKGYIDYKKNIFGPMNAKK